MEHIGTVTVGAGGAASISFSSIAANWTDLCILFSHRSTQTFSDGWNYPAIRLNGSTSGYSLRMLIGNGSTVNNYTYSGHSFYAYGNNSAQTANTFSNTNFYIPNYRSSSAKALMADGGTENNSATALRNVVGGAWTGTDPITSITILSLDSGLNNTPAFVAGTVASLYGIKHGSDGITTVS